MLEEIDSCLIRCNCLSIEQIQIVKSKKLDDYGFYVYEETLQVYDEYRLLNSLEKAEVNYICLHNCIEFPQ